MEETFIIIYYTTFLRLKKITPPRKLYWLVCGGGVNTTFRKIMIL